MLNLELNLVVWSHGVRFWFRTGLDHWTRYLLLEQQVPPAQYLDIFALMASHAIINLWPQQACSYTLFHFLTTWYYSLIFYWPLYHHFSMIPWLCDSIFFLFLLYLVMFVSHSSDVVPHSSATSEVTILYPMILCPTSYWLCTCS